VFLVFVLLILEYSIMAFSQTQLSAGLISLSRLEKTGQLATGTTGDEVIIGEGYFPYTTVFTHITTTLYRTAVFWPRNGSLALNNCGGVVTLCA
jgi:hypothetical protein